jgi:hypothetical protein
MRFPPFVARQRLGKDVPAAKKDVLEASFSAQFMSYEFKV